MLGHTEKHIEATINWGWNTMSLRQWFILSQ